MRYFAIFMMIILCGLSGFCQDSIPLNGYHTFYYPNGTKSSEGNLKNGKPEGWWKSYNEKGALVSEGNRKNNRLDSLWIFYNDNGDTTLSINYQNGMKNGKRIQFFTDERVVENWLSDSLLSPVYSYDLQGHLKRETPISFGKPHGIEKLFDTCGHIIQLSYFHMGIMTKRESINRTDLQGYIQGNWKFFWENGNLKTEGTYVNNKKHGFFKDYDANGNFLTVQKYDNDVLIEDAKETKQLTRKVSYHPNGQPSVIATFFNDKPDGIRREFDKDGNIIKGYVFNNGVLSAEGITDMEGKRNGKWKEFYETGELKAEGTYKNSARVGDWKYYFPDKSIEVVGSYNQRGEKTGEWQWFYPNQQLMMTENYEDGVLEGEYWEYDEEGKVLVKGQYIEGEQDGFWHFQRGIGFEEGNFYDGMRIGTWKTWYENEHLLSEIEYDHDLMNGKYTIFYPNSVIKRIGNYVNGEREGTWSDYYDTGELFLTTIYKNGKEIRWNNYKIEY